MDYTPKVLKVGDPMNVEYAIPLWLRNEQIRAATQRVRGRVAPHEKREEPIAVVCFGPSLAETWEKVKGFEYVMSCSGSHRFLVERGIVPAWHVEVDPRPHKVELIGPPQTGTEYLIASACHPKVFDHLEGYNVKLWHVFDAGEEAAQVLPRGEGEWLVTGGCSVGLRAMTMAAFLGFRELHIFGMDGCEGPAGNKHAAAHPNEAKKHSVVEYPEGSGIWYRTTKGMLQAAVETFHELDQMGPTVRAVFYGEGLVQAMARDYTPKPAARPDDFTNSIAVEVPTLISEEFRELNARLHRDNLQYGTSGQKHVYTVGQLAQSLNTTSILDYGCGKGLLARGLPFPIWEYDPAIPAKATPPRPADIVVCSDVLEHVEPEKLRFVLEDLRRCTRLIGYFVIHTGAAEKHYADGRNAHLIQKDRKWWTKMIGKYFKVGKVFTKHQGLELHFVVRAR